MSTPNDPKRPGEDAGAPDEAELRAAAANDDAADPVAADESAGEPTADDTIAAAAGDDAAEGDDADASAAPAGEAPDIVEQFFARERGAAPEAAPMPPAERQRCGFIALIGAPNAGKSTLVNALVGAKVSIVTHKVQTTRAIVRGIVLDGDAQVILVDTPGIFAPRRRLDRAMVKTAWMHAYDADRVCLLIDARRGIDEQNQTILDELTKVRIPKTLILTKIDLVEPATLLALAKAANEAGRFDATYMLSAKTGDGVGDLRAHLANSVPQGPWLYPPGEISDLPERQLAAEITREQLTLRLHDELPYSATVETETWKTLRNGSVRIEQAIFIEREGQKKIVLGEKGRTIRAISMAARAEIAKMTGAEVHLFLFVKVRPRWTDDPERYREMGLDFLK